ncbi:MAG: DUF1540 domain-containing protein [Lachnospiraceae bacterium]|nr:DUF1540 domain-containing protein [Lachnospiraceae bacterium]
MPLLDCSVETCVHNSDNRCCLSSIGVEGQYASREAETSCGSFAWRKECFCNKAEEPKRQLTVDCQAVDCVYNRDRMCSAGHIGIAGRTAHVSDETECQTFQAR